MYSPQPIVAGTVLFDSAFGWTTERLSPAHLSVFEQNLPGAILQSVDLPAPDIVARLAQHLQLLGDVAAPFCGVASRDAKRRSADIFFSCRDPVIGSQSLSIAAQIVYRLAQENLT